MRFMAIYILVLLGLGGCAPVGRDAAIGKGALAGRATLMRGAHDRACDDVTLTRTNETTSKIMSVLPIGPDGFVRALDFRKVEVDPDYARASRSAECDENGHFALTGLPTGQYYLIARLTWLLGHSLQGGFLIRHVDVLGADQTIDINSSEGR